MTIILITVMVRSSILEANQKKTRCNAILEAHYHGCQTKQMLRLERIPGHFSSRNLRDFIRFIANLTLAARESRQFVWIRTRTARG